MAEQETLNNTQQQEHNTCITTCTALALALALALSSSNSNSKLQLKLQHQLQLEKAMQGYGMQGMHVQCKATVAYVRHACATHACAMQGMHVTCEMQGYNTACKACMCNDSLHH